MKVKVKKVFFRCITLKKRVDGEFFILSVSLWFIGKIV